MAEFHLLLLFGNYKITQNHQSFLQDWIKPMDKRPASLGTRKAGLGHLGPETKSLLNYYLNKKLFCVFTKG
jgi:hypothetical protein